MSGIFSDRHQLDDVRGGPARVSVCVCDEDCR